MTSVLTDEIIDKIIKLEKIEHLSRDQVRTLCQYSGHSDVDPMDPRTLLLEDCWLQGSDKKYYNEVYLNPI